MIGVCFLDASFVIALMLKGDQNHLGAESAWQSLGRQGTRYVTTDYILCEIVAFFQSRGRQDLAVKSGELFFAASEIEFVQVDRDLLNSAWTRLVQHSDKSFSLADCVSFVLMEDLGIRDALTFDHHFAQAGFRMFPGP